MAAFLCLTGVKLNAERVANEWRKGIGGARIRTTWTTSRTTTVLPPLLREWGLRAPGSPGGRGTGVGGRGSAPMDEIEGTLRVVRNVFGEYLSVHVLQVL